MALKTEVHIETALRNERTILKRSFCGVPFKLADVTEDKGQKELRLMLMCSSPGVLDGDDYMFEIDVVEGSSLRLETQSYQRLFQMQHGATQNMNVRLQQSASLIYLPHPVVPHRHSNARMKNTIFLADDCTLFWSEVISCGRKLNGEVFQFTAYHNTTEIFKNGKLAVKENLLLRPSVMKLSGLGQMEGFTHQATVLFLHERINISSLTDAVYEHLSAVDEISFGVSALPVNGCVIRLLGHKAELLFALVKQLSTLVQSMQKTNAIKKEVHV